MFPDKHPIPHIQDFANSLTNKVFSRIDLVRVSSSPSTPITNRLHSPLGVAPTKPRETRQLDYIRQFSAEFKHIKGNQNVVADALTRTDVNTVTTVDLQKIAKHQAAETTPHIDMPSLEIIEVPLPFSHGNIFVNVSTGVHSPLVPENLCHKVFLSLHSLTPWSSRDIKTISATFHMASHG